MESKPTNTSSCLTCPYCRTKLRFVPDIEIDVEQLTDMLNLLKSKEVTKRLDQWEDKFLTSVLGSQSRGKEISEKQYIVIKKMYEKYQNEDE